GLTADDYALTVTDTLTGRSRVYQNGANRSGCGGIDTFPDVGPASFAAAPSSSLAPGQGDTLTLFGGSFGIVLQPTDPPTGRAAQGLAMPQDDGDGYFSLPEFSGDPALAEVFVRVSLGLDGSLLLRHTGLTDLAYALTVTDRTNGTVAVFTNDTTDALRPCGGS